MSAPIQLLCQGTEPPDLATSALGPFVVQGCADLDEVAGQLQVCRFDALLVHAACGEQLHALQHWNALSHAVLDLAVVVVTPEPGAGDLARLLQLGVQEVVPLDIARVHLPSLISIKVPVNGAGGGNTDDNDRATALRSLFQTKPGETEVRLRLEKPRDFSVILDVTVKVRPDKEFCAEVARICGAEALEVLAN